MADIFISYARKDVATAERLAHALEERGWSVFWDRHIPAGRNFDTFILEQIQAAACMVVLWSRAACESQWVLEEAREGRQRGILVPARLDNVDPPFGFGRIQCADLTGWRSAKNGGDLTPLIDAISVPVSQATKSAADDSKVHPGSPVPSNMISRFYHGKSTIGDLVGIFLSLAWALSTFFAVLGIAAALGDRKFTNSDSMALGIFIAVSIATATGVIYLRRRRLLKGKAAAGVGD